VSVVSDVKKAQQSKSFSQYDVVVVGAGPYGLATAAHLQSKGLRVGIFGKPLELWRDRMPKGMFLRSHWWATILSDPRNEYGFARFFKESPNHDICYPLPIDAFIDYGLWFQQHCVPNVDETYVSCVERVDGRYLLTLEDGRQVQSPAVVMAVGVYYFAHRPEEYTHLPAELLSHEFDHSDFSRFAGKQVLVIGAGQGAVEYSALLHENGASVHLASRRSIKWLGPDRGDSRPLLEKIKAPSSSIAPGWKNWALEYLPYLFYQFPQEKKDHFLATHYTAAAAHWLRDRVIGKVTLHERQKAKLSETDNGVEVVLTDGEKLNVDHVMMGTGYSVSLKKLSMLHESLASQIQTDNDIPLLNPWFESSVPGLYFVGLSSVRAFGPLYRFVVGNKATAQRVASSVARQVTHTR